MNQERFDDLTRALATGRISRRQVLKAAAGAAVAAGTLLNQREAEAAQQAADLERFYAGIKSDTQVEHEFGGMKAGILTPEEFRAEQHAARKEDEANADGLRLYSATCSMWCLASTYPTGRASLTGAGYGKRHSASPA